MSSDVVQNSLAKQSFGKIYISRVSVNLLDNHGNCQIKTLASSHRRDFEIRRMSVAFV